MRHKIAAIAIDAGKAIMEIYRKDNFGIETKKDGSPVTIADLAANDIIEARLRSEFPYPIVSEETFDPGQDRSSLPAYWLVDPLDGTKEFIAKKDSFTVNIALIKQHRPVFGVIYLPVLDEIFAAEDGVAYKADKVIHAGKKSGLEKALASRSHQGAEMATFLKLNGITESENYGSSLKFCRLAEGMGDIYPRFKPTSEWDTAAGQAICEAAGFEVFQMGGKKPLLYSKNSIRNPGFYVVRKGVLVRFSEDNIDDNSKDD
jgi:3'(2'), 5'-bisphosphate nucleotidase